MLHSDPGQYRAGAGQPQGQRGPAVQGAAVLATLCGLSGMISAHLLAGRLGLAAACAGSAVAGFATGRFAAGHIAAGHAGRGLLRRESPTAD